MIGSGEGGGCQKKKTLGIIDLTDRYYAFQNSKEHCHEQGVLLMVLCSPPKPILSQGSSQSGPAPSWWLHYLKHPPEHGKSMRVTSVFYISFACKHSLLTLFLRHFLSTVGHNTDCVGTTYFGLCSVQLREGTTG